MVLCASFKCNNNLKFQVVVFQVVVVVHEFCMMYDLNRTTYEILQVVIGITLFYIKYCYSFKYAYVKILVDTCTALLVIDLFV